MDILLRRVTQEDAFIGVVEFLPALRAGDPVGARVVGCNQQGLLDGLIPVFKIDKPVSSGAVGFVPPIPAEAERANSV